MELKDKVTKALQEHLRPDRIDLEDSDGISGYVVSSEFRGMSHLDRQTVIDNALRTSSTKLTQAEMRRILTIAGVTPAEYAAVGNGK